MQDKAKQNNFSITRESCNEIISLSGLDRGRINNSIESLMLYLETSSSREIGVEEVKLVLFDTNQSQINELCKNVCLGKTEESQKILSRLTLQGVTAPQFVSAFLRNRPPRWAPSRFVLAGPPKCAFLRRDIAYSII